MHQQEQKDLKTKDLRRIKKEHTPIRTSMEVFNIKSFEHSLVTLSYAEVWSLIRFSTSHHSSNYLSHLALEAGFTTNKRAWLKNITESLKTSKFTEITGHRIWLNKISQINRASSIIKVQKTPVNPLQEKKIPARVLLLWQRSFEIGRKLSVQIINHQKKSQLEKRNPEDKFLTIISG